MLLHSSYATIYPRMLTADPNDTHDPDPRLVQAVHCTESLAVQQLSGPTTPPLLILDVLLHSSGHRVRRCSGVLLLDRVPYGKRATLSRFGLQVKTQRRHVTCRQASRPNPIRMTGI